MDDQNKNLILASVLSFAVIGVWYMLFPPEQVQPVDPETAAVTQQTEVVAPQATADGETVPAETVQTAEAPRIAIETPALNGSISLAGGRIDTLSLDRYRETLDEGSPAVPLLAPVGSASPYYALYGWAPAGQLDSADVPGPNTVWQAGSNTTLTPTAPVELTWDNGNGLTFTRTISVDEDYMFSVKQTVTNATDAEIRMLPYGIIARHGEPDQTNFFILHEGVVRQTDTELAELSYEDMTDLDLVEREGALAEVEDVQENGWIGFTDKYWMTTLIPTPGQPFTTVAKYVPGADIYQVETRLPIVSVSAGQTAAVDTMLFAGAKEWETIKHYEEDTGIFRFDDSIDWGMFFFLTKPIFQALHFLSGLIGNMGWSIIALTFLIKAVLFPLAYKSYVSMARMKELQPEMEKIKERAGDDRQKLQQEMMTLYKSKKVNPASGCLPILLQIPIFFSLYKVIFVTIELRHAPWFGWIRDLSAPDPSSIFNLFGILPFAAPELGAFQFLSLGILPILLGISMWLQQKLNPAPADPAQAMIFAWMPWVFMFMLGNFASGLVVYWIANNTITFSQQYLIMRSQGYTPDLLGNIKSGFKKTPKSESK